MTEGANTAARERAAVEALQELAAAVGTFGGGDNQVVRDALKAAQSVLASHAD